MTALVSWLLTFTSHALVTNVELREVSTMKDELNKSHCSECDGPVYYPGFDYCPWCGKYLRKVVVFFRGMQPGGQKGQKVQYLVQHSGGWQQIVEAEDAEEHRGTTTEPYDPESGHCPSCTGPIVLPGFRYCAWCGFYLLENIAEGFDPERWERKRRETPPDLDDEHLRIVLLRG